MKKQQLSVILLHQQLGYLMMDTYRIKYILVTVHFNYILTTFKIIKQGFMNVLEQLVVVAYLELKLKSRSYVSLIHAANYIALIVDINNAI